MIQLSYREFKEQMEKHACKVCEHHAQFPDKPNDLQNPYCVDDYITYIEEIVQAYAG